MPTASLEAMLELWSTSLREAKDQLRPLFAAPSVARSASAFLEGLLGAQRRKTGWMAFAVLARVRQRANGLPPKTERRAKLARALVAAGDPAGREPTRATAH